MFRCAHSNAQTSNDEDRAANVNQQRKTKENDQVEWRVNRREEIIVEPVRLALIVATTRLEPISIVN